jgi:hypothetical protein
MDVTTVDLSVMGFNYVKIHNNNLKIKSPIKAAINNNYNYNEI